MARKTKDEAEKTKHAILDAAEKVFFAQGVSRTSLEQIATAASVTRGAVYWHFRDKASLCTAMAERILMPQEDMLQKLATHLSPTPIDDLKKACLHALSMLAKDKRRREVFSILLLRCEYTDEMLRIIKRRDTGVNKLLNLTEKLFFHAKELKTLAPHWTPRQAAVATHALMVGLVLGGLEKRKHYGFLSSGTVCVEAFFKSLQAY